MSEKTDLRCFCNICGGRVAFPPETAGTMAACPHCSAQIKLIMSPEAMAEDGVPLPGDDKPIPVRSAFPKPGERRFTAPPDDLVACRECGNVSTQANMTAEGDEWICFECRTPVKLAPSGQLQASLPVTGFGTRVVAKVVDILVLAVVVWLVSIVFRSLTGKVMVWLGKFSFLPKAGFFLKVLAAWITALPLIYLYHTWFLVARGATPGKMFAGIKVIDSNGDRLTWGRASARFLVELLLGCTLNVLFFQANYIIAAFDSQCRTYHDQWCKTWVVQESPPPRG